MSVQAMGQVYPVAYPRVQPVYPDKGEFFKCDFQLGGGTDEYDLVTAARMICAGGVTQQAAGLGFGRKFDGSDDLLTYPGATILPAGAWTLEALVKIDGVGGSTSRLLAQTSPSIIYLAYNDSVKAWEWNDAGPVRSANNSIVYGVWQHYVLTRSATGVINHYVNGVLSGTANQASTNNSSAGSKYIGNSSAQNRGFNGAVRMMATYPRILTPSEILQRYRECAWLVGLPV